MLCNGSLLLSVFWGDMPPVEARRAAPCDDTRRRNVLMRSGCAKNPRIKPYSKWRGSLDAEQGMRKTQVTA